MSSEQKKPEPTSPQLPISLDFGGPIGSGSTAFPAAPRRRQSQPSLPEPPGDPFKNKPPEFPSLF
ncbi:MAG: hypothetical protein SGJ27_09460 [Candidatus Melainabacteria bacterium]|nr:hypothetical protein [Candidatus Melainabacteria bacterium]